MKFEQHIALFVLFAALSANVARATPLQLEDEFNGSAVDVTKWQALTPLSDSQISVGGGTANFFQRGILIAQNDLPNAIQIDGRFAFTGGTNDQFQINLRTDGAVLTPYYNFPNNIYVGFNRRGGDDRPEGIDNIILAPGWSTTGVLTNFLFHTGVYYDFRIIDTGSDISVYLDDFSSPMLSIATSERTGNKIAMENRGVVPWFPTYDNSVNLDFIRVSNAHPSVPETGSTFLFFVVALTALVAGHHFAGGRRTCAPARAAK